MSEDIVKNSIICLANMKIEDTTYQIARDIVLQELQQKENIIKEVEKFVEEVLSSTKGVINDYMYHKEHNKEKIELLREDIVMYKHILEILDKGKSNEEDK